MLLLADGQPIMLGGRPYDVLMMPIEAHGTILTPGSGCDMQQGTCSA
jgi:hypothetical protein